MKSLLSLTILIVIVVILFAGGRVLLGNHHSSSSKNTSSTKHITDKKSKSIVSTTLPNPPLSCSTSVSLMSLTSDYSITGMGCTTPSVSGAVLDCNGVLIQNSTNVSINCSTPNAYQRVVCSGAANTSSSPGNLALNYTCHAPNTLSSDVVYSCSGVITGFSLLGINLPLNVSCTG